jgi:hypothetical protein
MISPASAPRTWTSPGCNQRRRYSDMLQDTAVGADHVSERAARSMEQQVLRASIEGLSRLSDEGRQRILKTLSVYFDVSLAHGQSPSSAARSDQKAAVSSREPAFGVRDAMTPKQFVMEKSPHTDVERVACLAYYLTHYRNTPHFKTIDISKLNTEAAQLKFSNAAVAVNNASLRGFVAAAGKGQKQLSAVGERFVDALPDRDAAKIALESMRPRRSRKRARNPSRNAR